MSTLLGRGFVDRYFELSRKKDSFLCVGLDPALRTMRSRYVVPQRLIELHGVQAGIKRFCLDVVEAVGPYTPIIKPNAQFVAYPLSLDEMKEIVKAIHDAECLALLDAKLSDISSTNAAALYWISEVGFDAVTFSPFPGFKDGTDSIYRWAEEEDKGIFALCRMSNPGTHDYQSLKLDGAPLYLRLTRDAFERGCNGFVVGCTASTELGEVRAIIGEDALMLAPGLGPQGGDPAVALRLGGNGAGEGLIIASSRSIDYAYETFGWSWERFAEAAAVQARMERDEFNGIRKRIKE